MTHSRVCHDSLYTIILTLLWSTGRRVRRQKNCVSFCVSFLDLFACVPWLFHTCAMTHLHVCNDSFTCATWLIYTCAMTYPHVFLLCLSGLICTYAYVFCVSPWLLFIYSCVCHDSSTCAMTPSHVCYDSFTCVPWLLHMCAMTYLRVCHDSFTCVPWLLHMCAMTPSHGCHDSFTCVP